MIENSLPHQHRNTPETASVVDAIIGEVELLFERKEDVLAQLTLDTATWGLAWWEKKFGLLTDLTKPDDHRRSCIRAKMRGAGTTTVAMLQNMAESFTNGEVEIVELTRQYKIIFRFVGSQGIPPNIEDLGASIREAIPAHIEYGFSYTYVTHEELASYKHEQMQQMTHEQIRISDVGDKAKARVTDTFAVVEKTSGYSLPLPLKTDNYNIAIVNEVTQLVDAALVDHKERIDPSAGKDAPDDADYLVVTDSKDGGKKKRLTFAHLWTYLLAKIKSLFYTKEESNAQNNTKADKEWAESSMETITSKTIKRGFGETCAGVFSGSVRDLDSGEWTCFSGVTDLPSSGVWFVKVFKHPSLVYKYLQCCRVTGGVLDIRECKNNNGLWTEWTPIATATPPQRVNVTLVSGLTGWCSAYKNQFYEKNVALTITSGTIQYNVVCAILPEGFRLTSSGYYPALALFANGGTKGCILAVRNNGEILPWSGAGGAIGLYANFRLEG